MKMKSIRSASSGSVIFYFRFDRADIWAIGFRNEVHHHHGIKDIWDELDKMHDRWTISGDDCDHEIPDAVKKFQKIQKIF